MKHSKPVNTSCTPKIKLPKSDLRKFSGVVLDWPEFWDIFRVAVHENPEVPQVQKFVYLKSLLTGEAPAYVANIKTEEANYEVAMHRLQSRYGRVEVQRNHLMTKLADMKPLEQSNKAMRNAVRLCVSASGTRSYPRTIWSPSYALDWIEASQGLEIEVGTRESWFGKRWCDLFEVGRIIGAWIGCP